MRTILPTTLALIALGAAGCTPPNNASFSGTDMKDLFPFDGERTWEFLNSDVSIPYKLIGTLQPEGEPMGAVTLYTVQFTKECVQVGEPCTDGELMWSTSWTSNLTDGVFIHRYTVADGAAVELDPPLQIATGRMKKDDVIETTTDGSTWTSELMGFEECPVNMAVSWDSCARLEVASSAGDGAPLAGTYWANAGFNVVAMELPWDIELWGLSKHTCNGECDGRW